MAKILVADDDPDARQALRLFLEQSGNHVIEASDGASALRMLVDEKPHAVLLDILMPGMDGFEVLRRIKTEPLEYQPPVLVVTGASDRSTRLRVLRAGADDCLAKPIDAEELLARLGILLRVSDHRHELAQKNEALMELQSFRDDLQNLLIHDLKNPLTVITGNLHYLGDTMRDQAASDMVEALDDAIDATSLLGRMIGNLLDVGRAEGGRLVLNRTPLHIGQLCRSIAEDHARAAQQRNVTITVEAADAIVEADRDVLRRVMQNLVENALRYVPGRGRILLGAHASDGKVLLEVGNSGPPVPAEIRSLVFEKYGQLRRRTGSPRIDLGLGLYFCRLALEAHGGRIHVEERVDFPTTFVIELPQLRPE